MRTSTARSQQEALTRIGTHNEAGVLTVEQWIQRAINQTPHHVKFIQEKGAAIGLSSAAGLDR